MFKEIKLQNISRKFHIIKRLSRYERKKITSKNKNWKFSGCIKHQTKPERIKKLEYIWISGPKYSLHRQGDGLYDEIKVKRDTEHDENV